MDVESAEVLYQRGLEAYRASTPDLSSARAHWSAALERRDELTAPQRARLCRSLGNLTFRQERPLEAAAWYTAAIRLDPRDGDAWSNLEFARSKAGLEPADRGDLAATFERATHALTRAESEWLALVMAILLAILIVLRAFVLGSAATRPLIMTGLLALVAAVPWFVHWRESDRDPVFVVSTAGVQVASEPSAAASKVALLPAGASAQRLEDVAGWTRVETEAGERGWVPAQAMFALKR